MHGLHAALQSFQEARHKRRDVEAAFMQNIAQELASLAAAPAGSVEVGAEAFIGWQTGVLVNAMPWHALSPHTLVGLSACAPRCHWICLFTNFVLI